MLEIQIINRRERIYPLSGLGNKENNHSKKLYIITTNKKTSKPKRQDITPEEPNLNIAKINEEILFNKKLKPRKLNQIIKNANGIALIKLRIILIDFQVFFYFSYPNDQQYLSGSAIYRLDAHYFQQNPS